MASPLKRHTSMRGRLALLLILALVLPMSLVGLLAYESLATSDHDAAAGAGSDDFDVSLRLGISEEAERLRHELQATLDDLTLRVLRFSSESRGAPRSPPDATADAADAKSGLRPTLVATVDRSGRALPELPAEVQSALGPLLQASQPAAGYVLIAEGSGPPHLHQVAFEPGRDGPGALMLRDVSPEGGHGLLEALPSGSHVLRALQLADLTTLAQSVGGQSSLSSRLPPHAEPGEMPWPPAADLRTTLSDPSADAASVRLIADVAFDVRPLCDPAGRPVALAVVAAAAADLLPQYERPTALLAQVRSLVGWVALTGVLLAIAIGVLAPRWVWNDIRDSTDSIFHSVERLRELVRRNSRALDEQTRVVRTLTSSASALKLASQSIADTTRALAHSAEQSAWVSQSGNQKAELSQRAVVEVRDRVEQISTQMEELQRRCMAIGSILGFIDHLSNETNTLSINATIQAVGTGSSGRQFSAVALEIRKLADLALESTRDIQQLIEQIQESSRTTLSATQEGCREVDKCLSSFEELESAFARILRWVEETTRSSRGIELSTARQSESLQSVVQSIEALEQRANETAGNFHEVVDSADELARLGADMNETWRVG